MCKHQFAHWGGSPLSVGGRRVTGYERIVSSGTLTIGLVVKKSQSKIVCNGKFRILVDYCLFWMTNIGYYLSIYEVSMNVWCFNVT